MIVLDTNVVAELMRSAPDATVIRWVDAQADSTLFLTTFTLAEIRYGIAALPDGRRRTGLSVAFEDRIRPIFEDRILDFDEAASRAYAKIRTRMRAVGHAIGDLDALIAAVVIAHGARLATRDVRPFAAPGITVVDPWR